jgi:hypothetical protein
MKPSSVLWVLILASWVFLLSHADAGEKNPSEKPPSKTEQKTNLGIKTESPSNQSPSIQNQPRSVVSQPTVNSNKDDSKKSSSNRGSFDFLFETQMPNWISILGWTIAALVAWFSLGAVRRQAYIADDSIKLTNQSLRTVERAWLSVTLAGDYTPQPESHLIDYVIHNGGKTPAKLKELVIRPINVGETLPTYDIPQIPEGPMKTLATVFASTSEGQIFQTRKMDRSVISKVNQGHLVMVISGWIIYDDVFDERHVTRFFQVYAPKLKNFIFPRDADPKYNEVT